MRKIIVIMVFIFLILFSHNLIYAQEVRESKVILLSGYVKEQKFSKKLVPKIIESKDSELFQKDLTLKELSPEKTITEDSKSLDEIALPTVPVSGAMLFIRNTSYITKSDSTGQFSFKIDLSAVPSLSIEVIVVKESFGIYTTSIDLKLRPKLEIILKRAAWQEVKFAGIVVDENSRPLAGVKLYFNHFYWSAQQTSDTLGGFYAIMKLPQSGVLFDVRAEKYGYLTTNFQVNSQSPGMKIMLKREQKKVTFHGKICEEVGDTIIPLKDAKIHIESKGTELPRIVKDVTTQSNGEFSIEISFYTLNPLFNVSVNKTYYNTLSVFLNLLEDSVLAASLKREMYTVTLSGITYERNYPSNTNKALGSVALELSGEVFSHNITSTANGYYSITLQVPKVKPQVTIATCKRFYGIITKTLTNLTSNRVENLILTPNLNTTEINFTIKYKNPLSNYPDSLINLSGATIKVYIDEARNNSLDIDSQTFTSNSYGRVEMSYTLPEAVRYISVTFSKDHFYELKRYYKNGFRAEQELVIMTPRVISKTIFGTVSIKDLATQVTFSRPHIPLELKVPGQQAVYKSTTTGGNYQFDFKCLEMSSPSVTVSLHLFGASTTVFETSSVTINAADHVSSTPVDIVTNTKNGTVRIRGSLVRGTFYETTLKIKWYEFADGLFLTEKSFNLTKADIDDFSVEIELWKAIHTITLVYSSSGYYDRIIKLDKLEFAGGDLIEVPVYGVSLSEIPLTRTVTGTVHDENNNPLSGVTISNNSTSVTTGANGIFSIQCTAGEGYPYIRITATKINYTTTSQLVDLKNLQSLQLTMPMLAHTITVKGSVNLPSSECIDISDYANFNISLTGGNESYTTKTDSSGNFTLSFTHYPVSAQTYTLKAEKTYYNSSITSISVGSYDINKDVVIEKILSPTLQKITRTITIKVFGYKNAALDGVSYQCSALAGTHFFTASGNFNKSKTHTFSLPKTNTKLSLTVNANLFNEYDKKVDISQLDTIIVNLIPEMHTITVSGKVTIAGELLLRQEQLMVKLDGEFIQYITTKEDGTCLLTLDVPKVAQKLVISHQGGMYHLNGEKVIMLYHKADRYEKRNLTCDWQMISANIDVKLFRHVYRSVSGVQTGIEENLEEGAFEIIGHNLYKSYYVTSAHNQIIDEISVPAYYPKVNFTLKAPQCIPETITFDVSQYNSINHTMHTVYNPDQIVTYYSGGDYTAGGSLLTNALIGDGWWDIPCDSSGYIKVGVAAGIAGAANVFGYRKFTHWAQKDCKAKIFMKVKWRFGEAQYTIGTAAETFDIVLNINGNHMSSLAHAGFSLFIPSPTAGWKDVAETGIDALLTFLQVACSKPGKYAELLLIYDYYVKRGQYINLHPGFQLKATALLGGSAAIIEGYIEGILIVEGDTTLNNIIYEWLTKGGDYEIYTQYHPYKVVCEGIGEFAFDQAMGDIVGGDGN